MLLSYTIRSIVARRRANLPTLLGIAATVGATVAVLAMLEGFTGVLAKTGSPVNAIVLSRGAPSEDVSSISMRGLNEIKVLPGIATASNSPLVSPEAVAVLPLRSSDGGIDLVTIRGVEPAALAVHQGVRLVSGAFPPPGGIGVVVGARQLGRFPSLVEGGTVEVFRQPWPVLGVLSAPGTRFESEIWCDRSALMSVLRRQALSSIAVTLVGPEAQSQFHDAVVKLVPEQRDAMSERAYYNRSSDTMLTYMHAVEVVILLLLFGAIFGATNAMYGAFLARTGEFATLRAIGYTPAKVAWIVMQEGLILALVAGALGLAASLAINGHTFSMTNLQVVYTATVSPRILAAGLGASAVIGVLGSLVAMIQASRADVLSSLREG